MGWQRVTIQIDRYIRGRLRGVQAGGVRDLPGALHPAAAGREAEGCRGRGQGRRRHGGRRAAGGREVLEAAVQLLRALRRGHPDGRGRVLRSHAGEHRAARGGPDAVRHRRRRHRRGRRQRDPVRHEVPARDRRGHGRRTPPRRRAQRGGLRRARPHGVRLRRLHALGRALRRAPHRRRVPLAAVGGPKPPGRRVLLAQGSSPPVV